MKTMSRLLSILLLVSMVFGLVSLNAYAESDGLTTVIFDENGTDVTGGSANGNVTVSADSADGVQGTGTSGTTGTASADADSVPVEAGSQYSILTTSANALAYFTSDKMKEENSMVYNNAKYIVYIREHMDELKQTNPEVVETAYALFGAEYLEMDFGKTTTVVTKTVALKAQADALKKIIAQLEVLQSNPADADGIIALRKETNSYRETFSGVANYDYTDELSAFSTVEAALEAAKAELATIQAEIAKLESEGDKQEKDQEENKEESKATPTPAPTTTPTPNDAVPTSTPTPTAEPASTPTPTAEPTPTPTPTTEPASTTAPVSEPTPAPAESNSEVSAVATAAAALKTPAVTLMSPLDIFKKLLGVFQTSAASLAGKTTHLTDTVVIYGLPGWPIIATLDNAVIYAPDGEYAFEIGSPQTVVTLEAATVYGGLIDVPYGNAVLKYIKGVDTTGGDGTVRCRGGRLEIGNCELDASGSSAVQCYSDGKVEINGYNKINCSSSSKAAVEVSGNGSLKIDATETSQSIISNVKFAGVKIDSGSVTATGNAKISGCWGVYVNGGTYTQSNSVRVDGMGKESVPNPTAAIYNGGGQVYISGGYLYAEYTYAIYSEVPTNTFIANGEEVIQTSKYDCSNMYTTGIITVDSKPVMDIATANSRIKDGSIVKLLGDVTSAVGFKVDTAISVTFNGNGHSLIVTGDNGVNVTSGSLNITNVSIQAPAANDAIHVAGSSEKTCTVTIGEGVIAKTGKNALNVLGGTVYVNGMTMYCTNGIVATMGSTSDVIVNSCKDNAAVPVDPASSPEALSILGGYFLTRGEVEDYLVKGISYMSKTTNSEGYYVVSMEFNPTAMVVNGTTGVDEKGIPYVVYDKSAPKYITFYVEPKVLRIDAVPLEGGSTINVFNNETHGGTEGNITIDFDAFQNNLDSGVYDLQFKYKNGYMMTGKLHLYVLPEVTKLVARANYQDCSDYYTGVKAENINIPVTEYRVGAKWYIYARVSELPTKLGVSADSTGTNVNWFGYYTKQVDGKTVIRKSDSRDCFILIDYAFLDQLSAGQDYIFFDYNGAIKRVSLKIVNDNVKISPTTLNFWGADTKAVFTVTPDFKDLYIDGELVPTPFITYDKNKHTLTISGEYLNQLNNGEHLMEVETSKGWLSATVHTGVGLKPVDVDYHVYGGAKALAFMASDKIDTTRGIYIGKNNPTKVDPTLIYFYDNNTKFTISPSYLNRLSIGTYYLSAYVYNGVDYEYTSTTFRIVSASSAAYNPGTGDEFNPLLWIGIALLAAAIVAVILIPTFKKKKAQTEENGMEKTASDETALAEEKPEDKTNLTEQENKNNKE